MFLHEHEKFIDVLNVVSQSKKVSPNFVEKDYWIMHTLWGLQEQGFDFYLKGGTSLSKGHRAINRFSEDLDVMIVPPVGMSVKVGKNHNKKHHRQSRKDYFDWLLKQILIDGIVEVEFDPFLRPDGKYRNADILLKYSTLSEASSSKLKEGILLEVGFDQVEPFTRKDISSWAYDFAKESGLKLHDNRAFEIRCYNPEYTFVEKLSAISKKFRQYQESGFRDRNFMRHYYDIYMLLKRADVQNFIGTKEYLEHKQKKFGAKDEMDLTKNEAFIVSDRETFDFFTNEHNMNSSLHYDGQFPSFKKIMSEIEKFLGKI